MALPSSGASMSPPVHANEDLGAAGLMTPGADMARVGRRYVLSLTTSEASLFCNLLDGISLFAYPVNGVYKIDMALSTGGKPTRSVVPGLVVLRFNIGSHRNSSFGLVEPVCSKSRHWLSAPYKTHGWGHHSPAAVHKSRGACGFHSSTGGLCPLLFFCAPSPAGH